jgi:NADH dehydrogenase
MDDFLVLGGTGFLGTAVCEKLEEYTGCADGRILVPSRHPARAGQLLTLPTVEVVRADLYDDAQLDRLVRGRHAVVNLVGILHGREADFQSVHAHLPARLARLCTLHGVRRLVHVSALGAQSDAPSMYLRSKAAGEAALKASPLDLVILRPSVMFGDGDRFMNRFASLQRIFPVMPLASASAKFQPVWVDDVALAVVRALDLPRPPQQVECVGPTVYTLRDLVRLAGHWAGHARPIIPLPEVLGRLQAGLLGLLPGTPLMSVDNLDSMKWPSVASGRLPTLQELGITPRTLESVMPAVLARRHGTARFQPWRALARRY